jgi:hypothetical protein
VITVISPYNLPNENRPEKLVEIASVSASFAYLWSMMPTNILYQKLYYSPFQITRKNSPCVNAKDILMQRNGNQNRSPHALICLIL